MRKRELDERLPVMLGFTVPMSCVDLVVLSGDLTEWDHRSEFEQAERFLDRAV
jgi:uncharacterized protein YhhL (DUF1145 family)